MTTTWLVVSNLWNLRSGQPGGIGVHANKDPKPSDGVRAFSRALRAFARNLRAFGRVQGHRFRAFGRNLPLLIRAFTRRNKPKAPRRNTF
jgi:hypothetical protein